MGCRVMDMVKKARGALSPEDLAVGPSAVVDAVEAHHRMKKAGLAFDWTDVIRTQLAAYGHEDATDGLIEICRRIAQGYAEAAISDERARLNAERVSEKETLRPLVAVLREFMQMVDLGPFDEVVGVAIKGPDGQIRIAGK